MNTFTRCSKWYVVVLACVCVPAHAVAINNGGFEAGFAGWIRTNQLGSEGTFALQTGTTSPVNGDTVPPPPKGLTAAMTDAAGPGSHLLYQDFTVTSPVSATLLQFSLFVGNRGADFFTPATLDFATTALNQQARVDILSTSADPFSVAAVDVLLNAFQTKLGDPPVSGYTDFAVDVTSLLNAHVGQTLRLRFAEVDNVNPFQFGVDNVSFTTAAVAAPEPSSGILIVSALALLLWRRGRSL